MTPHYDVVWDGTRARGAYLLIPEVPFAPTPAHLTPFRRPTTLTPDERRDLARTVKASTVLDAARLFHMTVAAVQSVVGPDDDLKAWARARQRKRRHES